MPVIYEVSYPSDAAGTGFEVEYFTNKATARRRAVEIAAGETPDYEVTITPVSLPAKRSLGWLCEMLSTVEPGTGTVNGWQKVSRGSDVEKVFGKKRL